MLLSGSRRSEPGRRIGRRSRSPDTEPLRRDWGLTGSACAGSQSEMVRQSRAMKARHSRSVVAWKMSLAPHASRWTLPWENPTHAARTPWLEHPLAGPPSSLVSLRAGVLPSSGRRDPGCRGGIRYLPKRGGGRAGLRRCSGDDVGAGADGDEVAGVVVELHASDDEAVPDAQREPFCREGDPDSWA